MVSEDFFFPPGLEKAARVNSSTTASVLLEQMKKNPSSAFKRKNWFGFQIEDSSAF